MCGSMTPARAARTRPNISTPSEVISIRTALASAGSALRVYQAGVFQAPHLHSHRRLRAVVECGEMGNACRALILDRAQQPRLRPRHVELCALGGQSVQLGDHTQKLDAK